MAKSALAIGAYPNIPVEGLVGATGLQERYGLDLSYYGPGGGTYSLLASGIAQGIPYQQTAETLGAMSWRTYAQQKEVASQYLQRWAQQGLTQEQTEILTAGAERMAGLGPLAPRFTMALPQPEWGGYKSKTFLIYRTEEQEYLERLRVLISYGLFLNATALSNRCWFSRNWS